MMTSALSAVSDELTGVASQQRQQKQLDLDLTKIKLETAKAQLASARMLPVASGAIGGKAARLGRATTPGTGVRTGGGTGKYTFNPAPGREIERKPAENIPGYMQVENTITGKPVWVMGSDGDPWDPIQAAMVYGQSAIQSATEAFYNGTEATFGQLPGVQKATSERDAMLAGLKKRMKFGSIPQADNVWRR